MKMEGGIREKRVDVIVPPAFAAKSAGAANSSVPSPRIFANGTKA